MTAPSTAARGAKLEREQRHFTVRNVEVREAGDGAGTLTLDGYACVTESPYEITDWLGAYTEVVRSGAFARTLGASDDVRLLLNHEGLPLARTKSGTLRLAEDSTGLAVTADLEPRSGMVNDIRVAMERGDLDEMSFAFQVTRQEWSPDYDAARHPGSEAVRRVRRDVPGEPGDVGRSARRRGRRPHERGPGPRSAGPPPGAFRADP
jgi:HK97 family phage prohead protease